MWHPGLLPAALIAAITAGSMACQPRGQTESTAPDSTPDASAPAAREPLQVLDDLEAKIAAESDTEADRKRAYDTVRSLEDDGSAEYALARAALAGRLAETRGLKAGRLVTEAERYARRSREADPDLREFAATRLLGSLYALAPARLVEHGDSEVGLEMLEDLVARRPEDPRARLRLAEAYIALGDPDGAGEHLCVARARKGELPADEQRLLDRLVKDYGGEESLACQA